MSSQLVQGGLLLAGWFGDIYTEWKIHIVPHLELPGTWGATGQCPRILGEDGIQSLKRVKSVGAQG